MKQKNKKLHQSLTLLTALCLVQPVTAQQGNPSSLPLELPKKVETPEYSLQVLPSSEGISFKYPESALGHAYRLELQQMRFTEEAERAQIKAKADYEYKKNETEREIAAKQFKIEDLKIRQKVAEAEAEAIAADLEHSKAEAAKVEKELAEVEHFAQEKFAHHDQLKLNFKLQTSELQDKLFTLMKEKNKLQEFANRSGMEVQRLQEQLASLQADVIAMDAKRTSLEADAEQVKSEWYLVQTELASIKQERQQQKVKLAEAQQKLAAVKNDYKLSKEELVKAEKLKAVNDANTKAELKRIDQQIFAAQRAKTMADAERIRIEAENERLQYYSDAMRKANREALLSSDEAQEYVMQSRLALEAARTGLSQAVSTAEKIDAAAEKREAQMRSLASKADTSGMLSGGKPWTTTKSCKIYKRTNTNSEVVGEYTPQLRLVASEVKSSSGWIKLLNSSGEAAFTKSNCGSFE